MENIYNPHESSPRIIGFTVNLPAPDHLETVNSAKNSEFCWSGLNVTRYCM